MKRGTAACARPSWFDKPTMQATFQTGAEGWGADPGMGGGWMSLGSYHGAVLRGALSLLLTVLVSLPASAQTASVDRVVAAIREQYEDIGRRIRQSEARKPDEVYGVGIVRSELVINKDGEPWRAVGLYRVVCTFWFHEAG